MSSLRNAVKRITHKERAQPRVRAHLGLLEKKQDYKKRAVDYQKKREYVTAMKLRADMRNPDEFYMGMHNSQMKDGTHKKMVGGTTSDGMDPDTIKLMKNQDLAYVRYQRQKEVKKIERLQSTLHFLNADATNHRDHIIFVDQPQKAEHFDVAQHFQTLPQFADRAFNRPRVVVDTTVSPNTTEDDEEPPVVVETEIRSTKLERRQLKKIAKARATSYAELEGRMKRQKAISNAEAHLAVEKLVSSKGRKRKVKEAEGGKPAVYKWRRQRAR
jgi:U3 small nucleolar RNA-associated protein 11